MLLGYGVPGTVPLGQIRANPLVHTMTVSGGSALPAAHQWAVTIARVAFGTTVPTTQQDSGRVLPLDVVQPRVSSFVASFVPGTGGEILTRLLMGVTTTRPVSKAWLLVHGPATALLRNITAGVGALSVGVLTLPRGIRTAVSHATTSIVRQTLAIAIVVRSPSLVQGALFLALRLRGVLSATTTTFGSTFAVSSKVLFAYSRVPAALSRAVHKGVAVATGYSLRLARALAAVVAFAVVGWAFVDARIDRSLRAYMRPTAVALKGVLHRVSTAHGRAGVIFRELYLTQRALTALWFSSTRALVSDRVVATRLVSAVIRSIDRIPLLTATASRAWVWSRQKGHAFFTATRAAAKAIKGSPLAAFSRSVSVAALGKRIGVFRALLTEGRASLAKTPVKLIRYATRSRLTRVVTSSRTLRVVTSARAQVRYSGLKLVRSAQQAVVTRAVNLRKLLRGPLSSSPTLTRNMRRLLRVKSGLALWVTKFHPVQQYALLVEAVAASAVSVWEGLIKRLKASLFAYGMPRVRDALGLFRARFAVGDPRVRHVEEYPMSETTTLLPPIEPVSEYENIMFDFGLTADPSTPVVSMVLTCTASMGDDAQASSRLIGAPAIGASHRTGAANLAVIQRVGNTVDGVTYRLQCDATLSDGQVKTLVAYLQARAS